MSVAKKIRHIIFKRDNNRCLLCLQVGGYKINPLTIDHIVPRSLGGDSRQINLQTLCRRCNNKKGNIIADYRSMKHRSKKSKKYIQKFKDKIEK